MTGNILDTFNQVDALVSDVSSVIPDFLFSEKPFALTLMAAEMTTAEFSADFPLAHAGYLLSSNLSNLDIVLQQLLATIRLGRGGGSSKPITLATFRPRATPMGSWPPRRSTSRHTDRRSLASRLQRLFRDLYRKWQVHWGRFRGPWGGQRLQVTDEGPCRFSVVIATEVILPSFDADSCERIGAQHGIERIVKCRQIPLDDVRRTAGGEAGSESSVSSPVATIANGFSDCMKSVTTPETSATIASATLASSAKLGLSAAAPQRCARCVASASAWRSF